MRDKQHIVRLGLIQRSQDRQYNESPTPCSMQISLRPRATSFTPNARTAEFKKRAVVNHPTDDLLPEDFDSR